jgi:hydroxymethylbilane synthase
MNKLKLGTRGSALALWQAHHVTDLLRRLPNGPDVEIVEIKTSGDAQTNIPLWKTAGKGFFTAELDRALIAGDIDLAVHSLKDLPTNMTPGLALAAVPEREDPRDALVCRAGVAPDALPAGARLGTSSLRRRAFVARWRPDFVHEELRGNVPTRVQKLDAGQYDAIILAVAGLKRLGLGERISRALPVADFPPAVAQGALGLVTRAGDAENLRIVGRLDHAVSRQAVTAERAVLNRLEGGCQIPLGAYARVEGNKLSLIAQVCAIDGRSSIDASESGTPDEAQELGERVAALLLKRGARDLLAALPMAVEG